MKQDRHGLTSVAPTTQHGPQDPAVQQRIAARAYQLFELRGGSHGSDVQDWLTAEREVMAATRGQRSRDARNHPASGHSPTRGKTRRAA
jgi:hypothetical protein